MLDKDEVFEIRFTLNDDHSFIGKYNKEDKTMIEYEIQ